MDSGRNGRTSALLTPLGARSHESAKASGPLSAGSPSDGARPS
jgi:hypothetical protein